MEIIKEFEEKRRAKHELLENVRVSRLCASLPAQNHPRHVPSFVVYSLVSCACECVQSMSRQALSQAVWRHACGEGWRKLFFECRPWATQSKRKNGNKKKIAQNSLKLRMISRSIHQITIITDSPNNGEKFICARNALHRTWRRSQKTRRAINGKRGKVNIEAARIYNWMPLCTR